MTVRVATLAVESAWAGTAWQWFSTMCFSKSAPPGEAVVASSAGRHAVLAMLVPVELDETVLRRLHALLTV